MVVKGIEFSIESDCHGGGGILTFTVSILVVFRFESTLFNYVTALVAREMIRLGSVRKVNNQIVILKLSPYPQKYKKYSESDFGSNQL